MNTSVQVFLNDTAIIQASVKENAIVEVFLLSDSELQALLN
jgi:hypothetical protein